MDGEHELAVRVRLEDEVGKFQVLDLAHINEVNDLASINHVSGQAVGMPRQNPGCLTFLNLGEHLVEDRPSGLLGSSAFDEFFAHGDTFALRKFP